MFRLYENRNQIEDGLGYYSRAFKNTDLDFEVIGAFDEIPIWDLEISKKLAPLFGDGVCVFQKNSDYGELPTKIKNFENSNLRNLKSYYLLKLPNLSDFINSVNSLNLHEDLFLTGCPLFETKPPSFDSIFGLTRFVLRDLIKYKALIVDCEYPPDLIFYHPELRDFFKNIFNPVPFRSS